MDSNLISGEGASAHGGDTGYHGMESTSPQPSEPPPPTDPPRRLTQVDHHPVTYTDEGEGPVVLMLHGLPGSARDFRYLSPRLSSFRRLRVDLPGFGGTSRQGKRVWSIGERAALMLGLLDALRVSQVLVLGHSMGGPIAVALANLAPDRVVGVALLSSTGLRPHRAFVRGRVTFFSRLLRLPGATRVLSVPLRRGYAAAGFSRHLSVEALSVAMVDAGAFEFPPQVQRMQALRAPTLLAWAENDRLIEPAISKEFAEAAPDGPRLV